MHSVSIRALSFVCMTFLAGAAVIRTGLEVLRMDGFSILRGERVAILSNPTGVFSDSLEHVVDVTSPMEGLDITAIFGPEHGFRGELQAETGDPLFYVDSSTELPVFSVYKMTDEAIRALIVDMNITTVLVDMQDVGVRLYTFIWTMFNVMEAAFMANSVDNKSFRGVKMVVCDRPNPLGGNVVDGPLLNMTCCASGYGKAPITHVHGMTIGELSLLFHAQLSKKYRSPEASVELEVVKMIGWERGMSWMDTGLPWIPPSPNVPTVQTAVAYPATCFLEATTVAEGRGSTTPFELFGAPFLSSQAMSANLNEAFSCPRELSCFRAAYFQPTFSKYNNTAVPAVQWLHSRLDLQTPSNGFLAMAPQSSLFEAGVAILVALKGLATPPEAFAWDGSWFGHPDTELIDMYAGTPRLRELIDQGETVSDITAIFAADASAFKIIRKEYLLY